MPHINLLPWREAQRAEKQRQFASMAAGGAMIAILGVVLIHLQYAGLIEGQKGRNEFLKTNIAEVDKQISEIKSLKADKKALLARMEVIQKLQTSRPEIVHIWEEVAKATPKGVHLTRTSRKNRSLALEGEADSHDSVSIFMRNLDASAWLTNPKLEIIQSVKGSSKFKLALEQATPETEADKAKTGNPGKKS
ncbi:MAG: PilN domain-containing protein [Gammaproteobacteria bacterium]|nr:PilN domain-containing protein [Gammaproteobacteria bacterium]MDH5801742.1 PilN domain-containing protein [Gammaproteobacteria bacterium]